jgi:hypothetical protein
MLGFDSRLVCAHNIVLQISFIPLNAQFPYDDISYAMHQQLQDGTVQHDRTFESH